MKSAITTAITGYLICAVTATPIPQWVPNQPGGLSLSSPVGGVSFGPGGFAANGLLGGISIGNPQGTPPPRPQQQQQQGGWGRGWYTDAGADTVAEGETVVPAETVEDTD